MNIGISLSEKKINYFLLFGNKNILTFLFEKQEYLLLKRVEL